ncbi:MAG TPA: hypothetical protein VIV58_00535 [Kofleriaceae bacterium]
MKRLVQVVLAVSLVSSLGACQKADGGGGGGGSNNQPDAAIPQNTTDVSSDVTTPTTWSGLVKVHAAITVASGVTLTIDPGTVIQLDAAAGITVNGTVTANGAKGNVVTIGPATGNKYWRQWTIPSGGVLNLTYVEQTGGAFSISGTAKVMARDSEFSNAGNAVDMFVASGGTLDLQYSWLGEPEGTTDTTHCNMHFQGSQFTSLTISHSNVSTAAYGIMLYGGQVDLTYDNWFGNGVDVDRQATGTGDVSNGYFKKGNPTASGSLTANNLATSMVADAGPR